MPKIIFTAILLLIPVAGFASDYIDLVKQGNLAFVDEDFQTAADLYHSAETELPESSELEYNLAGTNYKMEGYEEAVERYTKALNSQDINLEQKAHYNLGNTYFRMGDFQNSIKSYENALNLSPDDMDAKFNLELARRMLKEQMKSEDKDQDKQEKQEQQEQEKQDQQEQNKDENKDKQEQQDQQQQDQQQQDKQQQDQQPQPTEEDEKMSKEDAERILNALKNDEQDIQKKIKRKISASNYSGKDW